MNEEPFVQKYLVRDPKGSMYGPADAALLRQWVQEGRIVRGMRIAEQETREWMEASQHPAVADLLQGGPPVPPPAPPVQTPAPVAGTAPATPGPASAPGIPLVAATAPTSPALAPAPGSRQPPPHLAPLAAPHITPAASPSTSPAAPALASGAPIAAQPATPAAARTNPSQQSYAGTASLGGAGPSANPLPSIPRSPLIVAAETRARAAAQAAQMAQAAQAIQAGQPVPGAPAAQGGQAAQAGRVPAPAAYLTTAAPRSPAAASPAPGFAAPMLPSLPQPAAAPVGAEYELRAVNEPLMRPALAESTPNLLAILAFCGSLCALLVNLGFCIPFLALVVVPLSLLLAGAAIVLASVALYQFRTIPRREARRGLAIAGLTIGVVNIAFFAAAAVVAVIVAVWQSRS